MEADSGLSEKADKENFIVVYPNGTGNQGSWNAGSCCEGNASDDVAFVKLLVNQLHGKFLIDEDRIFAVGMSNGAMLANRLACELPEIIAAIGTVAGVRVVDPCTPSRPVAILHIHGDIDRVVPYDGKDGVLTGLSVQQHIDFWVKCNRSTANSLELSNDTRVSTQTLYAASPVQPSADVMLITIKGGGHLWPGQPFPSRITDPVRKKLLGTTTQKLSANDEIWKFFVNHPKR